MLLLSELSRLGRNVRKILDVTDDLTKAGINIHMHPQAKKKATLFRWPREIILDFFL